MAMREEEMPKGRDLAAEENDNPEGVKFVDPSEPDPEPQFGEEGMILHGGEAQGMDPQAMLQSVRGRVMSSSIPVPTRVLRALPAMRAAAEDPRMPATARDMYRTLVLAIDERVKNGR